MVVSGVGLSSSEYLCSSSCENVLDWGVRGVSGIKESDDNDGDASDADAADDDDDVDDDVDDDGDGGGCGGVGSAVMTRCSLDLITMSCLQLRCAPLPTPATLRNTRLGRRRRRMMASA